MSEFINIGGLCRCCHSQGTLKSLNDSYIFEGREEIYLNMLQQAFSLDIKPAPEISAAFSICNVCIPRLCDAFLFQQQIVSCERSFYQYHNTHYKVVFYNEPIKDEVEEKEIEIKEEPFNQNQDRNCSEELNQKYDDDTLSDRGDLDDQPLSTLTTQVDASWTPLPDERSSPLREGCKREVIQLQDMLGDGYENKESDPSAHQKQVDTDTLSKCTYLTIRDLKKKHESCQCQVNSGKYTISLREIIKSDPMPTSQDLNLDLTQALLHHEDPCQPYINQCILAGRELEPSTNQTITTNITPSTKNSSTKKTNEIAIDKKRLAHKENWKVDMRKKNKNEGKSFINQKGKYIAAKCLGQTCTFSCRFKCQWHLLSQAVQQREYIFNKFWSLGERCRHWEIVINYTDGIPKRRVTTDRIKHDPKNTFTYYLPTADKETSL